MRLRHMDKFSSRMLKYKRGGTAARNYGEDYVLSVEEDRYRGAIDIRRVPGWMRMENVRCTLCKGIEKGPEDLSITACLECYKEQSDGGRFPKEEVVEESECDRELRMVWLNARRLLSNCPGNNPHNE